MKDRRAAKLKALRRAERMEELQAQKKAFYADMDEHYKARGMIPRYNHKYAWQAQKRLQKELQRKSIMVALLAAMYYLNKEEQHWSTDRLFKYVSNVKKTVDFLSERDIDKLCEELRYDAGIDLKEMCRSNDKAKSDEASVILAWSAYSLTVVLYPLYNDYNWKARKRMPRVAKNVYDVMRDILVHNKTAEIIGQLEDRIGIRISLDGQAAVVG
jgi:hypothetical protein